MKKLSFFAFIFSFFSVSLVFADTNSTQMNTLYRQQIRPIDCPTHEGFVKWRTCRDVSRSQQLLNQNMALKSSAENKIISNARLKAGTFETQRAGLEPWVTIPYKNRLRKAFWANDAVKKTYFKPETETTVPRKIQYTRYNRRAVEAENSGYERTGKKKLIDWYLRR